MPRNRHQKPKCSRGISLSLLVSCIPLSVLSCFLLSQPMELTSLWLAHFFLNCLCYLNMEYSLSYVFYSDVFFKILVPGLCQPFQDSESAWLKTILRRKWQCHSCGGRGLVPEALSCVPALGDAEPDQLLCPLLCQAQLGPPLQTRLGGKGEKWRSLMTAQICFWTEEQPWSFVLQQHDHLESMEIESGRWPGNYWHGFHAW